MSDFTATKLPQFNPPAHLQDLTLENQKKWSADKIAGWMQLEITSKYPDGDPLTGGDGVARTPLQQFFNGTVTAYDQGAATVPIPWTAFPNLVNTAYNNQTPLRWQVADSSRIFQDEYLEWSVNRDSKGNILSVTFTCEGPEYWQFMGDYQPDTLVSLYNEYNGDITGKLGEADLFLINEANGAKVYNPNNYWNFTSTTGSIAHLIHPSNTLSAEIDIAAQSTVLRKGKDGKIITDQTKLTNCSKYGNPGRHSDPTIGIHINSAVKDGGSITIADPVALYIHTFDTSMLKLDITGAGTGQGLKPLPPGTINFERGDITKNQGLRLKIQIPKGVVGTGPSNKGVQLTVSDIYDTNTNQNIEYGAQFTDNIKMSVSGALIPNTPVGPILDCPRVPSQPQANGVANGVSNGTSNGVSSTVASLVANGANKLGLTGSTSRPKAKRIGR